MMRKIALLLTLASPAAMAGQFCLVSPIGTQCHYYSLSACQQAAEGLDGACVVNQQQELQPITVQPVNPYPAPQAYRAPQNVASQILAMGEAGAEAGRRARMHEEQMKLIQLQQQQARKGLVIYECPGGEAPTLTPKVGCVVVYAP